MIPGPGRVSPVSPAARQDGLAPDWAATPPPGTPHQGSPEPRLGGKKKNIRQTSELRKVRAMQQLFSGK